MQSVWSRALHSKCTCRCPSCIVFGTKSALTRQSTTSARQVSRISAGDAFAIFSSSVLATAAIAESQRRDESKRQLNEEIQNVREEVRRVKKGQDKRLEALKDKKLGLEPQSTAHPKEQTRSLGAGDRDRLRPKRQRSGVPTSSAGSNAAFQTALGQKARHGRTSKNLKSLQISDDQVSQRNAKSPCSDGKAQRRTSDAGSQINLDQRRAGHLASSIILKPEINESLDIQQVNKGNPEAVALSSPLASSLQASSRCSTTATQIYAAVQGGHWQQPDDPRLEAQLALLQYQIDADKRLQAACVELEDDLVSPATDASWEELMSWSKQQREHRQKIEDKLPLRDTGGAGNTNHVIRHDLRGISTSDLQRFPREILREICQAGRLHEMRKGVTSKEAWMIIPHTQRMTCKKKHVLQLSVTKLILKMKRRTLPRSQLSAAIEFYTQQAAVLLNGVKSVPAFVQLPRLKLPKLPNYTQDITLVYEVRNRDMNQHIAERLGSCENTCDLQFKEAIKTVCYTMLTSTTPPDVHTFNIILLEFLRLREFELASYIVDALIEARVRPNEITVATVLRFYTLTKKRDEFEKFVELASARGHGLMLASPHRRITFLERGKFTIRRSSRSTDLSQNMSSDCLELRDLAYRGPFQTTHKSGRVLKVYEKAPINGDTYAELISGYLNLGMIDTAKSYFIQMIQHGWDCSMAVIRSIVEECAKVRSWEMARNIWSSLEQADVELDSSVYLALSRILCASDRAQEYEQLIRHALNKGALSAEDGCDTICFDEARQIYLPLSSWYAGKESEARQISEDLAEEFEKLRMMTEELNARSGVLNPYVAYTEIRPDRGESEGQPEWSDHDLRRNLQLLEEACQPKINKSVLIRLKWGQTEYKGNLVSVDAYMNIQLSNTEEFIDGESTGSLGQVLIR
ncbi:hypothetical protein MMC25_005632 [Agyrium rufum]|nr:hypothetical protein [Agyrium rufum]